MSTQLAALAQALKRLPAQLQQATEDVVQNNTAFLEDANTAQLTAGKDSAGADITPEYAPLTVSIKQVKGQPTDRVTLRDDGDFHSSIVARLTGARSFEMVGTDPKTPGLTQKYGEDILGLSDESIEEFRQDYVKPELQQKAREALGI